MKLVIRGAAAVACATALVLASALRANAYPYASGTRTCSSNVRGYIQVWKNAGALNVYAPGDNSINGVLQVASYLKVTGAYGGGLWGVDGTGSSGGPVGDIWKIVTGCNKAM